MSSPSLEELSSALYLQALPKYLCLLLSGLLLLLPRHDFCFHHSPECHKAMNHNLILIMTNGPSAKLSAYNISFNPHSNQRHQYRIIF